MNAQSSTNLYGEIIGITDRYLGPASERFVQRQIRNHLGKAPDQLSQKDILPLINWIKVTLAVITDDDEVIESYVGELEQLTGQKDQDS